MSTDAARNDLEKVRSLHAEGIVDDETLRKAETRLAEAEKSADEAPLREAAKARGLRKGVAVGVLGGIFVTFLEVMWESGNYRFKDTVSGIMWCSFVFAMAAPFCGAVAVIWFQDSELKKLAAVHESGDSF